MQWGLWEQNLSLFIDSDMISLLFTVGYMVIRLIGTLVPKVNYFLNTTLEINP